MSAEPVDVHEMSKRVQNINITNESATMFLPAIEEVENCIKIGAKKCGYNVVVFLTDGDAEEPWVDIQKRLERMHFAKYLFHVSVTC